jgi:anti-sigma regulatory factor (Ser/Thr protein kinase)
MQQHMMQTLARLDVGRREALLSRLGATGSRLFPGTADQVGAVRDFARTRLAGHAASADAVLVASELAANAVAHSDSRLQGGLFMAHLSVLGPDHVVVIVTDQGGPDRPCARRAGPEAEDGRGLLVVRSLAPIVELIEQAGLRSVLAVVGPSGGQPAVSPGNRHMTTLRLTKVSTSD